VAKFNPRNVKFGLKHLDLLLGWDYLLCTKEAPMLLERGISSSKNDDNLGKELACSP
jgi:hypothetical protein